MSRLTVQQKISRGSFGSVYQCQDDKQRTWAAKICRNGERGLPFLLEGSIMCSIQHPNLNASSKVSCDQEYTWFLSDLAKGDFRHLTHGERKITYAFNQARGWCFQLAQAVKALHTGGIIHADIKSANVLLSSDDKVKLTDFSLSCRVESGKVLTHKVCTGTHRPPECLLGRPWDISVDIWALGVTFYEIAYGDYLFPYQEFPHEVGKHPSGWDAIVEKRLLYCISDWIRGRRGFPAQTAPWKLPVGKKMEYLPVTLPSAFRDRNRQLLNNLLVQMLQIDPRKRPTIVEVLAHPFFKGMVEPVWMVMTKDPVANPISYSDDHPILHSNPMVARTLADLIRKCDVPPDYHLSEREIWWGLFYIACKLHMHFDIQTPLECSRVVEIERILAQQIFRFLFE